MSDETVLKFDKISMVVSSWDGAFPTQVTFDWTEPSSYCAFSDAEYSADIYKEDAIEIIKALKKAFDL